MLEQTTKPRYETILKKKWRHHNGGTKKARDQKVEHTSAYVSIRQHTSAYAYADVYDFEKSGVTSAYVSIRQHTSAYVSVCIR
jgi:hypothetical protein